MLPTYVDNLRQYLFDADGQLLSEITLRGDSISGWQGELKDGTYTFVLWGNLGGTNEQIITTKSNMNINEMTLSAEQQGIPPGYRGNTDRLYYGTATVEVKNGAAQRRRIYLSHAHAAMNYEGEVIGEFVTFRYTSSTHQLWSLWRDGEQIVKDIDLNLFFNKLPMDMDTNMEQEFDLLVTVYENKIVVTQATASDWDEGGAIG